MQFARTSVGIVHGLLSEALHQLSKLSDVVSQARGSHGRVFYAGYCFVIAHHIA